MFVYIHTYTYIHTYICYDVCVYYVLDMFCIYVELLVSSVLSFKLRMLLPLQTLKEYFSCILSLAWSLLCSQSTPVVSFASVLYKNAFSYFDVYDRQVSACDRQLSACDRQVSACDRQVSTCDRQVSARDRQVSARDRQVSARDRQVSACDRQVTDR